MFLLTASVLVCVVSVALGATITFPCGYSNCSLEEWGQYCDEGVCQSCERFYDRCHSDSGCLEHTPSKCLEAFLRSAVQGKGLLEEKLKNATSLPAAKEGETGGLPSTREIAFIILTVILTVVCGVLAVLLARKGVCCRWKCCSQTANKGSSPTTTTTTSPTTTTTTSPTTTPSTSASASSLKEETEPLCYADEKLKGVDETNTQKPSEFVPSAHQYRDQQPTAETSATETV